MRKARRAILCGVLVAGLPWLAGGCSGSEGELGSPPWGHGEIEVPAERLASSGARQRGRTLFREHCALCHGVRADGRGVRRHALSPLPADFTNPVWRRKTTPRRLFVVIREGRRGTSMPAWKALEEKEIWDLVAYVLSVAEEGR